MANPGFPRQEAPIPKGDVNLLFSQNFPENCMKMKDIDAEHHDQVRESGSDGHKLTKIASLIISIVLQRIFS